MSQKFLSQKILKLRRVQPLQTLTAFLVGLTFLVSIILGASAYELPAQAVSLTPEAKAYQVDHSDTQVRVNPGQYKDKVEETGGELGDSLKNTADTVRERLNLDQPLPESTKDFFKQVRGEDVTVEEPRPSGKSSGDHDPSLPLR